MRDDNNKEKTLSRKEWLAKHGFRDPFDSEARHTEGDKLLEDYPDVFIRFPNDSEIRGSINDPGPRFVFAKRGCGKTAFRVSMEKGFKENLEKGVDPAILFVSYNDFDTVLSKANDDPDKVVKPRHHIEQIILLILEKLFDVLTDESLSNSSVAKAKFEDDESRKRLLWFISVYGALHPWQLDRLIARLQGVKHFLSGETAVEFAKSIANLANETLSPPPLQKIIGKAIDIIRLPNPNEIDKGRISLRDSLEDVLQVCQQFGFQGIFVLVDDVDEPQYYGTNEDFRPAYDLIHSLASASKLLGIPGIVFKFFLPQEI